jgi:hypothetical protein
MLVGHHTPHWDLELLRTLEELLSMEYSCFSFFGHEKQEERHSNFRFNKIKQVLSS